MKVERSWLGSEVMVARSLSCFEGKVASSLVVVVVRAARIAEKVASRLQLAGTTESSLVALVMGVVASTGSLVAEVRVVSSWEPEVRVASN